MRAANQFADVTTGVVYIHASPAAVCPHVEWALSSTLNSRANLKWTPQPAMPGQLRAVTNWVGPVGTGAQLANALRSWSVLRFEVTEDPSQGVDGHRWCHTPQLGLWSGAMSANGDVMFQAAHATAPLENVQVHQFTGLAVDFVHQMGARVMIRGVRPLTDIAGEFTMMLANRHLDPQIETVFLMADEQFAHVSSSLIKQIAPLASDEQLAKFVPREIIPELRMKIPAAPR